MQLETERATFEDSSEKTKCLKLKIELKTGKNR